MNSKTGDKCASGVPRGTKLARPNERHQSTYEIDTTVHHLTLLQDIMENFPGTVQQLQQQPTHHIPPGSDLPFATAQLLARRTRRRLQGHAMQTRQPGSEEASSFSMHKSLQNHHKEGRGDRSRMGPLHDDSVAHERLDILQDETTDVVLGINVGMEQREKLACG